MKPFLWGCLIGAVVSAIGFMFLIGGPRQCMQIIMMRYFGMGEK